LIVGFTPRASTGRRIVRARVMKRAAVPCRGVTMDLDYRTLAQELIFPEAGRLRVEFKGKTVDSAAHLTRRS
jgi:hypothetical protein